MKTLFYLTPPKQVKNDTIAYCYCDESVERWLDDITNIKEAGQQLHNYVRDMNTVQLDNKARLSALEKLKPYFDKLKISLHPKMASAGYPKEYDVLDAVKLIIAIDKEFAKGYWSILKELKEKKSFFFKNKNIGLSLYRILESFSEINLYLKVNGEPYPSMIWLDIHSLYAMSLKLGINGEQILIDNKEGPCIGFLYNRIILFSLLDFSALLPREIFTSYSIVGEVSELIKIIDNPVYGKKNQCVIVVDEDVAPCWLSNYTKSKKCRFIVTSAIISYMAKKKLTIDKKASRFSPANLFKTGAICSELINNVELMLYGDYTPTRLLFTDRVSCYFSMGLSQAFNFRNNLEDNDSSVEYFAETSSDKFLSTNCENNGILSIGSLISLRKESSEKWNRVLCVVKTIKVTQRSKVIFDLSLVTLQYNVAYLEIINNVNKEPRIEVLIFDVSHGNEPVQKYFITESFLLDINAHYTLILPKKSFEIVISEQTHIGVSCLQYKFKLASVSLVDHGLDYKA